MNMTLYVAIGNIVHRFDINLSEIHRFCVGFYSSFLHFLIFKCAELDFTDEAEEKHCNSSTRAYELSLNQETGRIVCDKTSDECGKHVCICDER